MTKTSGRILAEARGSTGQDGPRAALRRVRAFVFAFVLVASQTLGLLGSGVTTAYAADGTESTTVTTGGVVGGQPAGGSIHGFTDSDGNVLFCADFSRDHPTTGITYTTSGWSGDYALDYIVAHGYSASDPTADVYGTSGDDAHVATNYAIYAEIQGSTNLVDTNYSPSSPVYQAAHALYDAAVAFSTSAGHETAPEAGVSRIWDSGDSALQRMVGGVAKGTLSITKTSSNSNLSDDNACYSLEGAVYGVYSDAACTTQVTTVTLDANGKASATVKAGTYYVKEVTAPQGYALDTEAHATTVSSGFTTELAVSDIPYNDPVTMLVRKIDAQTGKTVPQGGASLAGAEYTVRYYDNLTGDTSGTSTRTWVLKTDSDGYCTLAKDYVVSGDALYTDTNGYPTIPDGTITVTETKAPTGYLLPDPVLVSTQIINPEANKTSSTVFSYNTTTVGEQAIRGDVEFNKVDGDTMVGMADVVFKVTSKTTGETHYVVTDANGEASTASSANAHTGSTNANDAAVTANADGTHTIDESKLNGSAGVWFYGSATDTSAKADDSLGALPYDTYTWTELTSSATVGHNLVSFTTVVSKNGVTVDRGTVDDNEISIGTTFTDADGSSVVACGSKVPLVDKVTYDGLTPGQSYTMTMTIHQKAADGMDAGTLKDADGNAITATVTFTPSTASGTVDVPVTIDTTELAGQSLVAFEDLSDSTGTLIVSHAVITDTGETVIVSPTIHTKVSSSTIEAATNQVVKDQVTISGLTVGETYTVNGSGHLVSSDGTDGGSLGIGTTTFTATDTTQTVEVDVTIDASSLSDGDKVVVFEDLKDSTGTVIAKHEDLTDTDETVTVTAPDTTTTMPHLGAGILPFVLVGLAGAGAVTLFVTRKRGRKTV